MDNHIRDAELIGMFADAIKQDGIVTVLACLCDGMNVVSVLRSAGEPTDRRMIIAHYLLLETLSKIENAA
jgi:hypothetical protein